MTYENGRKRQDVWSKRTWEAPDKEAESQKPTVLNREQAQKLQADNAPKRLTGGGESGIINEKSNKPIIAITDSVIQNVQYVGIYGYTEE